MGSRLGGVSCLAGGVEVSDTPDDPAVDGLVSNPVSTAGSLRGAGFLRAGTPSGHVHYKHIKTNGNQLQISYTPPAGHAYSACN